MSSIKKVPVTIIYHDNCADGFTAAHVAWKYYSSRAAAFDIVLKPMQYSDTFNVEDFPENSIVTIVDFSLSQENMRKLLERVAFVTVIDHHKGAREAVEAFNTHNRVSIVFSEEKCGAMLAWEYFFPTQDVPYFIQLVDDRDRWQWKLFETEEFSEALCYQERTLENWDKLILAGSAAVDGLVTIGTSLLHAKKQRIEYAVKNSHKICIPEFGIFPAFNTCNDISEIGNALAGMSDNSIGLVYFKLPKGGWKFSVRGVGAADTLPLSKHFGGGGHTLASGFEVSDKEFMQILSYTEDLA